MSDLEMTRLCAEAMGYDETSDLKSGGVWLERDAGIGTRLYDPLHDDAQAMALVKKFNLFVNWNSPTEVWCMPMDQAKYGHLSDSPDCADLNRAIVECVAKIQNGRKV